jgi:hypothetical protein
MWDRCLRTWDVEDWDLSTEFSYTNTIEGFALCPEYLSAKRTPKGFLEKRQEMALERQRIILVSPKSDTLLLLYRVRISNSTASELKVQCKYIARQWSGCNCRYITRLSSVPKNHRVKRARHWSLGRCSSSQERQAIRILDFQESLQWPCEKFMDSTCQVSTLQRFRYLELLFCL